MHSIRRARKARKVLTEFLLKDGRKLRIDVLIWGNKEYARELGYYGNVIYKPVVVDKNGTAETIYRGRKGLPTLEELSNLYRKWKPLLADRDERARLKEVADTIHELAEEKTYFDGRQAHVVYNLLHIARKEPIFTIANLKDVEKLSLGISPAIVVSFKGYSFVRLVNEFIHGTKMYDMLKIMRSFDDQIEQWMSDLKHDLSILLETKDKGVSEEEPPKIRLDDVAEELQRTISQLR